MSAVNEILNDMTIIYTHIESLLDKYIESIVDNENEKSKFLPDSITYNISDKEELEDQQKILIAENYLRILGITVKTDYGYYRNTYDILLDLGNYLLKNNK